MLPLAPCSFALRTLFTLHPAATGQPPHPLVACAPGGESPVRLMTSACCEPGLPTFPCRAGPSGRVACT
eukprot:5081887-Prymnesium_polylepis.1